MKKRILPALLALCMVMSLLPATMLTASADEVTKCPNCGCSPICEECRAEEAEATTAPTTEPTSAPTPTPTEEVTGAPQQGVAAQAEGDGEAESPCQCKAGADGHSCGASCKFQICGVKECTNYGQYEDTTGGHTLTNTECNPLLSTCSKGDGNLEATGHNVDNCPIVCKDAPGCTKAQGHKTAHTSGTPCTGDKRCGATEHQANCTSDANATPSAAVTVTPSPAVEETLAPGTAAVATKKYSKTTVILERVVEVYVACTCDEKHDANDAHVSSSASPAPTDCPNKVAVQPTTGTEAKGVKAKVNVSIAVEVEYNWELKYVKDEHGNYVVENGAVVPEKTINDKAEADAKAKAEKSVNANSSDYDDKFGDALAAAVSNYEALNKPLCSLCAGQGVVVCTMARDCEAKTHEDNCLKLCTGDKNCPNDAGVATAHQVTYVIQKTTLASGRTEEMAGTYDAKSLAADKATALNAAEKAKETAEFSYVVVAKYCPVAGIPDSVVVTADGEDVEEPTDTTDEAKVPEKAEDFADLKGDEWYAEDLTALIEKGIFIGSKNAEGKYAFNSTGNVTLKEMVVLLSRVAGEDLVTTGDGGTWFVAALNWATEAGLVEGVEDGTLARKDVVLTLWRLAGSPEVEQDLADFEDAAELEGDYLAAMKWAVANEIIKGDGDTGLLKTDANITRAEMVAVLDRYTKLEK